MWYTDPSDPAHGLYGNYRFGQILELPDGVRFLDIG